MTKTSVSEALRVQSGALDLAALDPRATPGFNGDKHDAPKATADLGASMAELQERLYADSRGGGGRSVLLVLQGMDTSGKFSNIQRQRKGGALAGRGAGSGGERDQV